jgi:hypothetical protein
VRPGVTEVAAFILSVLLSTVAPVYAQSPPPAASPAPLPAPGFMPPYEVTKIVRSAGFDPLAPPLREGTTYVLRATDFRGILMRVVVDAHSGAIRAVNRIVPPGPGPYGPTIGMVTPPYAMAPPYGAPPAYGPGGPEVDMLPEEGALAEPLSPAPPPTSRSAARPSVAVPPLPRPRPAELAASDAKAGVKPSEPPAAAPPPAAPAVPVALKKPPPPPMNE